MGALTRCVQEDGRRSLFLSLPCSPRVHACSQPNPYPKASPSTPCVALNCNFVHNPGVAACLCVYDVMCWCTTGDGDCHDPLRKSCCGGRAVHQVFARASEEAGGAAHGRTG